MFQKFQKKTAVNLITGSLGAGKTTLLRNFLQQKPANEHWAVLVNEFGAIGIDGAILSENQNISVSQIPGGCICCTAQGELTEAIDDILKTHQLDRLFIEPTGLGEPDVLIDLLQGAFFQERFDVQTTFAVMDASTAKVAEFSKFVIMQNLVNMADVIVFNKRDLASQDNLDELINFAESLYPSKAKIITTQQAEADISLLNINKVEVVGKSAINTLATKHLLMPQLENNGKHNSQAPKDTDNTYLNKELPGLVNYQTQQQLNTLSIGWVFDNSVEFDWSLLYQLFQSFEKLTVEQSPLRAKGVFKVGKPRMLFQWVNKNPATREYIAYRRDSRIELLLPDSSSFDLTSFEKQIASCQKSK